MTNPPRVSELVVFSDPRHVAARVLLPALAEELSTRRDLRCSAIVVPAMERYRARRLRWHGQRLKRRLQVCLGSGRWERALDLGPVAIESLASGIGASLLAIAGGDPNAPEVLRWLDDRPEGAVALNLYCVRRFGSVLLERLALTVNYHNGRLPTFRGLRATNGSIYAGEPSTGFCFHRMDEGIDSGPVLRCGEVAMAAGDTAADIELAKVRAAAAMLRDVLDTLSTREAGRPQAGMPCIHSATAFELATRVEEPSSLSRAEWERRLRAFLRVSTRLNGRWWPVTSLAPCVRGARRSFVTADGYCLQICGADFWPAVLAVGSHRDV